MIEGGKKMMGKTDTRLVDSFVVEIREEIIKEFNVFGYKIKITKETEKIKEIPQRRNER